MEIFNRLFQGSTQIWVITMLLAVFSFLPVFSASSSIGMHMIHVGFGLLLAILTHRIPYRFWRGPLSPLLLWISIILLAFTIAQGATISGANSSRWIYIFGMSFQTSALANVSLLLFISRTISKKEGVWKFKESFQTLLWPIFLICALVLPANLSTSILIFINSIILLFVGGYNSKHIAKLFGLGTAFLIVFILTAKAFPDMIPNRVDTWISRIETFAIEGENAENYQKKIAMTAIAEGKITGLGPGRGLHKHFLPQNNSDFIYATIVEEYGLIGGTVIVLMYLWFMLACVRVTNRAKDLFGRLIVIGLSFSICLQALINMAVATSLFPITGQTLPLVSAGGSSIWMTCFAIGIILSVSRGRGDGEIMDHDIKTFQDLEIKSLNIQGDE
ncbi:MAG: putative peptidoglycan glycosyltransferase FtsW [Owenweeksia sp. TMED14]|nr:MAG: putative peptidoglycan glycosyltransferase FtsW [Owenweeksia sp. TMED14]|tara:strand:+ start:1091 stop:2257 length:1167 start_codon:yes stop_codon:yes gene_type:complete